MKELLIKAIIAFSEGNYAEFFQSNSNDQHFGDVMDIMQLVTTVRKIGVKEGRKIENHQMVFRFLSNLKNDEQLFTFVTINGESVDYQPLRESEWFSLDKFRKNNGVAIWAESEDELKKKYLAHPDGLPFV